jgi:hypothetical protein
MTESDFLVYCQNQVKGPLKDEDIILMLTAWGQISYNLGYNQALKEQKTKAEDDPGTEKD